MEQVNADGATVEELLAKVAELSDALAYERAKSQVLAEQLVAAEDERVKQDLESFADVVGEEDKEVWTDALVANREKAIAALTRIRNRSKAAVPAADDKVDKADKAGEAVAPGAASAAPDKVAPRPLHNRAAVRVPGVAETASPAAESARARARVTKIANRAKELLGVRGMSFDAAWRQAENEIVE